MPNTKTVFLVDNYQPQLFELDIRVQQLVSTDDDVDTAIGQRADCGVLFCFASEPSNSLLFLRSPSVYSFVDLWRSWLEPITPVGRWLL